MPSTIALEVKRVPHSEDLLHPGDFVFIEKREPRRTFQSVPNDPPAGFFKRLWWTWFGKKYEIKQTIELQWPEYDAVILNCPHCNGPLATTAGHKIISLDPLTIETPIGCSYSRAKGIATEAREEERTFAFIVRDGKVIPA